VTVIYLARTETGGKDRVFEPFFTTNTKDGMGSRHLPHIVEAHGGTLSVTANHPRGSIFCFTLPRAPEPCVNATIFVVDDDAAIRDSHALVIESNGWKSKPTLPPSVLDSYTPSRLGCLILDGDAGMSGPELQKCSTNDRLMADHLHSARTAPCRTAVRAMQGRGGGLHHEAVQHVTLLEPSTVWWNVRASRDINRQGKPRARTPGKTDRARGEILEWLSHR